jgi:outer membrane immunogenic protein
MKWRNSFVAVAGYTVASLMTFDAQAQSAFTGFYGQVSTGY